MVKRILNYLSDHALAAVALVCSLLALAGSSYAAFTISGSQIQNHSVDPVKLNPRFIAGSVRAWARLAPDGHLIAGGGGPRTSELSNGVYVVDWKAKFGGRCATTATVDEVTSPSTETVNTPQLTASYKAGYASAGTSSGRHIRDTVVETFNQNGQPTPLGSDVIVVC